MAPISPFFSFKDPSDIQWSGNQRLTSNQLRGLVDYGFDPSISIGGITGPDWNPDDPFSPGVRGIYQDGIQIGSTSQRNVQAAAPGEGFSLFSTAANGQADPLPPVTTVVDGVDGEGALPGGPGDWPEPEADTRSGFDPVVVSTTAADDGTEWDWNIGERPEDSIYRPLEGYDPSFDQNLRSYVQQHFGSREYNALYGNKPAIAFRNLGADPIVQMLVAGERPSAEQMGDLTRKFIAEMERILASPTEIVQSVTGSTPAGRLPSVFMTNLYGMPPELLNMFAELPGTIGTDILANLGGLGADILGGLDIPGLADTIGTDIRGAIDPLTGADFGLDAIESDIFGVGGLRERLSELGLDDLARAIGVQSGRLGGLEQQLSQKMQFPAGFVKTAGTLEEQLGGITSDLGELGTSPVPDALFTNLGRSKGLLEELIGGSFQNEYGYPAQQTGLLAEALGQGKELDTLLGGLPVPPDLSGPLLDALHLNELFTLGGTKLTELDTAMGELPPLTLDDLLPGKEELTSAWDERKPGPLAIDDLLPSRDLLREQLAYRAPSRLTAGELLPDETLLDKAWTAMRPAPLTVKGMLPDETLLDTAWTGMRPDPLTAKGRLPTDLMDEWNLMRPQQLLSGDLLPDDMDTAWTDMRPERLTTGQLLPSEFDLKRDLGLRAPTLAPDRLLPSEYELQEALGLRAPSPLTAGQLLPDMDALRGEFEGLGLDPLNALLDRLDLGGLDPLGGLEDSSAYVGPLNDLLTGIQAGDFEGLQDLLEQAGDSFKIPGLEDILGLLGGEPPGLGGQIKGLTEYLTPEIEKIKKLLGSEGVGRGGGVTDISGLEDSLADILARLDSSDGLQPSGSGGVFEELLDAIRPGFTDIRSQIQEMTAELIPQIRSQLVAEGFEGDLDAEATRRAQAQAAGILRSDPITASILADQEEQDRLREREDRELLQRFGVLRGGQTIDLANLRADDQSRAELAALGQAAERADERFTGAIGAGTDIAGLLERRELARAGELGWLDGQRTMPGQDQDAALLSSIFTMLQKGFNPLTTEDTQQVALVRSLMPLLSPDVRDALEKMLEDAGFPP